METKTANEIDWRQLLGWGEAECQDLRVVGYSYLQQGKYKRALPFFEALVILSPAEPYHHQTLGALYLQLGRFEQALETLEEALILSPSHPPTLLNKAKALFSRGLHKETHQLASRLQHSPLPSISGPAQALLIAIGLQVDGRGLLHGSGTSSRAGRD